MTFPPMPNFKPVGLSTEETEIRQWLKENQQSLRGSTMAEVAYMAVLCGFNLNDVCKTFSNFIDPFGGSHVDKRAEIHVWKTEMDGLHSRYKELDLSEQWRSLARKTQQ